MAELRGGYWAVVPAAVRYDDRLPERAKLLYAELSALADVKGYCWATDSHFAELYGVSVPTINRALRSLRDAGYIRVEITGGKAGSERHIYCGVFAPPTAEGGLIKNDQTPPGGVIKNDQTPLIKNDQTPPLTQYKRNNKKINIAPLNAELATMMVEFADGDEQLLRDLMDMAEMRAKKGKPYKTPRMVNLLFGRLRSFGRGSHELMHRLLESAINGYWDTVYEPKPGDLEGIEPEHAGDGREISYWRPGDE